MAFTIQPVPYQALFEAELRRSHYLLTDARSLRSKDRGIFQYQDHQEAKILHRILHVIEASAMDHL